MPKIEKKSSIKKTEKSESIPAENMVSAARDGTPRQDLGAVLDGTLASRLDGAAPSQREGISRATTLNSTSRRSMYPKKSKKENYSGRSKDHDDYNDRSWGSSSDMDQDSNDRSDSKGMGKRSFHKKKVCRFCSDSDFVLDYKDGRVMQSFLTEACKIVPRRISGNCAKHQRVLTVAVKRARHLAMVSFVGSAV